MTPKIFTFKFGINSCYVIKDKGAIMIDGGPPNKRKAFLKQIKKFSIDPEEIQLMVLTHGDFDHVGSAKEIKESTGAQIAIHEKDKMNLEQGRFNWPKGVTTWGKFSRTIFYPILKRLKVPVAKADIVLGDEGLSLLEYGIEGKVIYTPGHTPGSVSVLLDSGEAFVGCLTHSGFPFRFKPALPIYADNIELIKESWRSLIEKGAKHIFPGHGKPFSVESIMKYVY
jgi:glyoxylase-like metal-dependent hydrolase (beta-lactamase superfamily II)